MSLLALLRSSSLLTPFMAVASLSTDTLTEWARSSSILRLFFKNPTLDPRTSQQPASRFSGWLETVLLILTLGLFPAFSVLDTTAIGFLVWGVASLAVCHWLMTSRSVRGISILDVLVTLFFLSALVSTAFSSYRMASLEGLFKFGTFFIGFVIFRYVSQLRPGNLLWMMTSLLLTGLAQVYIGFYQYANDVQPLATWVDPKLNAELKMTRIFGTLLPFNPNLLAGFLIPCMAGMIGLTGWVTTQAKTRSLGWPLALATCLTLAAVVLTGSRGAYLAIAAMALSGFLISGLLIWQHSSLMIIHRFKKLWALTGLGVMGLAGLALATSQGLQHRVLSIFAMREDSSISYRLNVYESTLRMFLDNWLVGIGPGNDTFKLVYGLYMVPGYNALGAYSVPLEIGVEQGLLGLLLFSILIISTGLRRLVCLERAETSLSQKIWVSALLVGIVGLCTQGVFDTVWYRPSVNLLFWLLMACLISVSEQAFSYHQNNPEYLKNSGLQDDPAMKVSAASSTLNRHFSNHHTAVHTAGCI
jgi:putative inorganic carbon (hco3(-)) transporter